MHPNFAHTCDRCTFLGQSGGHDLYMCDTDDELFATVIARYGNNPSEYASSPARQVKRCLAELRKYADMSPIVDAFELAEQSGALAPMLRRYAKDHARGIV